METTPHDEKEVAPKPTELILAIAGLPRSGKTTLVDYLNLELAKLGYPVSIFSFSTHLKEALEKEDITNPMRKQYDRKSQELRPSDNPAQVIESYPSNTIVIVDGLRNADEAIEVSVKRGVIVTLVCPPPARFERAQKSGSQKDSTDTIDDFLNPEKSELFSYKPNGSHTEFTMSLAAPGLRFNTSLLSMAQIAKKVVEWLKNNNKLPVKQND
ncbi:AAA family ATPase [Candidatus Nomurabacteria bacterium]|nr:AAA family ATPase [Candidatus Nomurabacteria bacterium]